MELSTSQIENQSVKDWMDFGLSQSPNQKDWLLKANVSGPWESLLRHPPLMIHLCGQIS
jgi:hypothetical protein